ncbi:MAG: pyridoxal phosphate-dependent aminotransferase family protein [Anaerohalosphaera sp.]|nr:pyridoxal phosphate-dependent aminotransferase family protein [Anaerohalosphaera sp.]
MNKFAFIDRLIEDIDRASLRRQLVRVDSAQGTVIKTGGSEKALFCSNNYLNIAEDRLVKDAVIKTVNQYGYGSAASRLISGTSTLHVELEKTFANFLNKEAAILLPSGWTANEALLRTLPQKGDIVLIDKLDHASIIDAVRQGQAEFHTYRRDRLDRLEKYLADTRYERKWIVTESVFSMDGDSADIRELVRLKEKYDAILIVDEAHGFGCLGQNGKGLAEQAGVLDAVDIIVVPLGKAVAANGGIVASKQNVIDYLVNRARAFIYTTASSAVNCAAVLAGLEIIRDQPERRKRLHANTIYLRQKLQQMGLDTGPGSTHIVPVIIGQTRDALRVSKELFERGYFVSAIRPPTVPEGTARLRISLQSNHTTEQIDGLIKSLQGVL